MEFKKGIDILSAVGGIATLGEARNLFAQRLDQKHLARLAMIANEEALLKIANAIAMCLPDHVFVHTGSDEDCEIVRRMSLEKNEEAPLAIPGHTIHFDLPEDQGRMVDQTFYIVNEDERVSSLAKKELRSQSHTYIREHMRGIMQGKTMFVGFYSRGPVGAKASIPAIEISSSTYVFHSAALLYRNCYADFDAEVARRGEFFTNGDTLATLTRCLLYHCRRIGEILNSFIKGDVCLNQQNWATRSAKKSGRRRFLLCARDCWTPSSTCCRRRSFRW